MKRARGHGVHPGGGHVHRAHWRLNRRMEEHDAVGPGREWDRAHLRTHASLAIRLIRPSVS